MTHNTTKVALVTGGSSGIGADTAITLAKAGFTVYAGARRLERMKPLEAHGIKLIALDVTDEASATACVHSVLEAESRIDVLVNNAGYGSYGAIEDVPLEEAQSQFDVNIFGLARMIQLVLPTMRQQRSGTIVNISSVGGKIYTRFGGWYHASKFALEALSDCLRVETQAMGINTVIIEPGGIKTDWGAIAADNLQKTSGGGAYGKMADRAADQMRNLYQGDRLSDPQVVADAILKAVTAEKPKIRYAVGLGARPLIALRALLPDRAFDALVTRS